MFSVQVPNDNLLIIECGNQWTNEDSHQAMALGEQHAGGVLVVDLSLLRLGNGYTLVDFPKSFPYSAIVLVCGTLENRIKVELFIRLNALPCPFVPVMRLDEVIGVVTGLNWSESGDAIQ